MFKKVCVFKYEAEEAIDPIKLATLISDKTFRACEPKEKKSIGFYPPQGEGHQLIECISNEIILGFKSESKSVPSSNLKTLLDQKIKLYKEEFSVAPNKLKKRELKEEAIVELLPAVLGRITTNYLWIDRSLQIIVIDSTKTDDVISYLMQCFNDKLKIFKLLNLDVAAAVKSLIADENSWGSSFALGRDCTLVNTIVKSSVIKFKNHSLITQMDIQSHISKGNEIKDMAIAFEPEPLTSITFNLNNKFHISKIRTQFEIDDHDKNDKFFVEAILKVQALRRLLIELIPICTTEH